MHQKGGLGHSISFRAQDAPEGRLGAKPGDTKGKHLPGILTMQREQLKFAAGRVPCSGQSSLR
eukprot:1160428-Pelagomonas_calceolata.AAC.3